MVEDNSLVAILPPSLRTATSNTRAAVDETDRKLNHQLRHRSGSAMLKFAWRWADVGDKVLIHDRNKIERDLIPGVVAYVSRVSSVTTMGVRVVDEGVEKMIWPTPLFVHPDPLDPAETDCWICAENAQRSSQHKVAS